MDRKIVCFISIEKLLFSVNISLRVTVSAETLWMLKYLLKKWVHVPENAFGFAGTGKTIQYALLLFVSWVSLILNKIFYTECSLYYSLISIKWLLLWNINSLLECSFVLQELFSVLLILLYLLLYVCFYDHLNLPI